MPDTSPDIGDHLRAVIELWTTRSLRAKDQGNLELTIQAISRKFQAQCLLAAHEGQQAPDEPDEIGNFRLEDVAGCRIAEPELHFPHFGLGDEP